MRLLSLNMFRELTLEADLHSPENAHSPSLSNINTTSPFQRRFRVGGLTLELSGASPRDVDAGELQQFEADSLDFDINVNVRWAETLHNIPCKQVFESGATWRLLPLAEELVFEFTSPLLGADPYKRLCVNRSFSRAELVLNRLALNGHEHISPIEYPVSELLVTNFLAQHGLGVEVHGCGLIDSEDSGHLFLGHSGAGKSTTARLWDTFHRAEILSDDRIILRLHDGELWMYGTPWHGEAAFAGAGRVKLTNIFVLGHGAANNFSLFPKAQAVGEIFARSFPPFHSSYGLERTVEFLKQVVDTVPCYEFQFVPDQSAISSVLAFHE
jgi:hypothetical protein